MVTLVVFATLAGVGACSELVHGKGESLVCLNGQRAERHRTRHEVLHNRLHRLHFLYRCWLRRLLEAHEVAQEYRLLLLVNQLLPLLILLVRAQPCGKLQGGNGVRRPCVLNAVLAVVEQSRVGQEAIELLGQEGVVVQPYRVACYVTQPYASDG